MVFIIDRYPNPTLSNRALFKGSLAGGMSRFASAVLDSGSKAIFCVSPMDIQVAITKGYDVIFWDHVSVSLSDPIAPVVQALTGTRQYGALSLLRPGLSKSYSHRLFDSSTGLPENSLVIDGGSSGFLAQYWEIDWVAILADELDRILSFNLEGVFLQDIDLYPFYLTTRPDAQNEVKNLLFDLIGAIRQAGKRVILETNLFITDLEVLRKIDGIVYKGFFWQNGVRASFSERLLVEDSLAKTGREVFIYDSVDTPEKRMELAIRSHQRSYVPMYDAEAGVVHIPDNEKVFPISNNGRGWEAEVFGLHRGMNRVRFFSGKVKLNEAHVRFKLTSIADLIKSSRFFSVGDLESPFSLNGHVVYDMRDASLPDNPYFPPEECCSVTQPVPCNPPARLEAGQTRLLAAILSFGLVGLQRFSETSENVFLVSDFNSPFFHSWLQEKQLQRILDEELAPLRLRLLDTVSIVIDGTRRISYVSGSIHNLFLIRLPQAVLCFGDEIGRAALSFILDNVDHYKNQLDNESLLIISANAISDPFLPGFGNISILPAIEK